MRKGILGLLVFLSIASSVADAKTGGHYKCQNDDKTLYSYVELLTGKEMNSGWAHSKQWPYCYAVFTIQGAETETVIVVMKKFKINGSVFLPKHIPEKFTGYDQNHRYWRFSHQEPGGGE